MYCKNLYRRMNGKLRCKIIKQEITLSYCAKCREFEPRNNTPMKKKSSKLKKLENNRFSIFTKDLKRCYYCHKKATDIHEVWGGSNRQRSMKLGFCIPLCRECHSNNETVELLKERLQREYEKMGNPREKFIEVIGRSYIND